MASSSNSRRPNVSYVEALVKALRAAGVTEYEADGMKIHFGAKAVDPESEVRAVPVLQPLMEPGEIPITGVHANPMLYPGGRIPYFPEPGDALPPEED